MDLDGLVDHLKRKNYIKSEHVEQAFRNTDRAIFVPEKYRMSTYDDRALPIGEEETISAPHMVAINTELLEPQPGNRVVEVGSGSGYQIAILARMADEVFGVDINEELVRKSRKNLEKAGEFQNAEIRIGSGLEPVEGLFDRILFSCAISQDRFEESKKRLTEDGILVAPVEQNGAQIMKKFRAKSGETTEHERVGFIKFKED